MVRYGEWLEALKMSASATLESSGACGVEQVARINPAIRLLEFFERIRGKGYGDGTKYREGVGCWCEAEGMSAVDGTMMRRWVEGWIGEGD